MLITIKTTNQSINLPNQTFISWKANVLYSNILASFMKKGKGESHVQFRMLGECPLEGHLS